MTNTRELVALIGRLNATQASFFPDALADLTAAERDDLEAYVESCLQEGLTLDHIARSYLLIVNDTLKEQVYFQRHKRYRYRSFAEVADSVYFNDDYMNKGSPDIKVGRSPGRSDQELCDLGRNRLIHGFFWDLPEQYFLASVDGRLRRPRSGWGACSAAAKSRRKVFNL